MAHRRAGRRPHAGGARARGPGATCATARRATCCVWPARRHRLPRRAPGVGQTTITISSRAGAARRPTATGCRPDRMLMLSYVYPAHGAARRCLVKMFPFGAPAGGIILYALAVFLKLFHTSLRPLGPSASARTHCAHLGRARACRCGPDLWRRRPPAPRPLGISASRTRAHQPKSN